MNENTRNTFAAWGLEILKRSVLEVLYQQRENGDSYRGYVKMSQIQQDLGIPKARSDKDALIHGILVRLRDEKTAKYIRDEYPEHRGRGLWCITEKGVSVIEGDPPAER